MRIGSHQSSSTNNTSTVIIIINTIIAGKFGDSSYGNFQPCSKLCARLQQACDNLALILARCTQPCDYPLQAGAHNLAKVIHNFT